MKKKSLFKKLVHKLICFKDFKDSPLLDLETNKLYYPRIWYVAGFNVKVMYIPCNNEK